MMGDSTTDANFESHLQDDLRPHNRDDEFEIGILKPHNNAAQNSFNEVVQGMQSLPQTLQRNIRVKLSDRWNDDSAAGISYEGHFAVSFYRGNNDEGQLDCIIGRGHSDFGETRGVSHLVISPGQNFRGVMPQHVSIRLDPECGMLAIVPLSMNVPVLVFKGNGIRTIYPGEKYLIEDLMTLFTIGQSEYIFKVHELLKSGLEKFKWLRDSAFHHYGLSQPDGRIQPLPTRRPFNHIGSTIIHQMFSQGASADIWSGVNAVTGKVVAVKRLLIFHPAHLDFFSEEVKINLNFSAHEALLQAKEVCDDQGFIFGPGQGQACLDHFRMMKFPYNMYLTMPMMENDVLEWWFSKPPRQRSYEEAVEVFRLPAEMIAKFHKAGYILRDVSAKNIFKQKDTLAGKLGDFGLAIHATTHTLLHLGPVEFRAPECDGTTAYNNKIDVYAFGMAMLCLLYPEVLTDKFGFVNTAPQSLVWNSKVSEYLEYHAIDSNTHLAINSIIQNMIHPKAARRLTMALALKQWPTYIKARPAKNCPDKMRAKLNNHSGYV